MSRLDVFIDRMVSQRACLDHSAQMLAEVPGPVFEFGLGNGRTFHHMRETMADREIYVFERVVAPNPASMPHARFIIEGDIRDTLPEMLARFGPSAVLIHADLGGHNLEKNDAFAREISAALEPLLAPQGLFVSSDKMYFPNLVEKPLPANAVPGRCFIYGH